MVFSTLTGRSVALAENAGKDFLVARRRRAVAGWRLKPVQEKQP
jgi:hypothetical protein